MAEGYAEEVPDIPTYRELPAVQIGAPNTRGVRIEVENPSSLSLGRDYHGHTSLHLASARVLGSIRNTLENRSAEEAVILLGEKTRVEGWTSLHISTLKNDAAIVDYILSKVNNAEQRQKFIDEVDNKLGWTSLQWGAALDKVEAVEATMNRMSLNHQRQVMTGNWTLLHATAKFDAVNTMQSLMQRVKVNRDEKWLILTCPTSDGKTALHIAVAEGNARAAILLLDLAGGSSSDLSSLKDRDGKKSQDYTEKFSLLGEYLALAEVTFKEPVLHMAARQEDRLLVSWILDQYANEKLTAINRRSDDGSTVLHVCSEANSPLVIKEISQRLSAEEFMTSVKKPNNEGQSALHLSASKNNPASTHAILSSVNKENRKDLLMLSNQSGECPTELAKQLGYQDVIKIFEYHHMILSEGLRAFFYQFKYSLFSLEILPDNITTRYKRLEERREDDRGLMRHANLDATICILYGDIERAERLVAAAVKVDGENMHTWCNQGMLKLNKEQPDEAEGAAFWVLNLMTDGSTVCQMRPKIDFAYWMAEVIRTEESRDECCEILQDCQTQASQDIKMQEFLSYCFVKILVRHLRSDDKYDKARAWYKDKLDKAVEQLIILSRSDNIQYRADMWLWLAEIQYINIPINYLARPLEIFCRETEITSVDLKYCHEQVMKLENNEKVNLEKKMRARIAKNCLNIAYKCKGDPREWFNTAIEMSEKWIQDNCWILMCASTCSQGLLYLWAIEFYEKHGDMVREQYSRLRRKEIVEPKEAWYFLTTHFYSADVATNYTTQKHLGRAKGHLSKIVETADGWISHGIKYARIKFLLGDPRPEVEEAFNNAISWTENLVRRVKAREHLGCYHLASKRYEQAALAFKMAIIEGKSAQTGYGTPVAHQGIKLINRSLNTSRNF